MLEGTELSYAYSSIMDSNQDYNDISDLVAEVQQIASSNVAKSKEYKRQNTQPGYVNNNTSLPNNALTQQLAAMQKQYNQQSQNTQSQYTQPQYTQPQNSKPQYAQPQYTQPQYAQQPPQKPQYDINMFNKQFEQEQKIATLMNEIKAQKAKQYSQYQQPIYEDTYWDKMTNKKKELMRFVQSGLIVLFAISLHFVIDFVLKHYLQANDVSYNREVIIRILYPMGILFISWNIIAFIK
jgi:hypothetical protein